MPGSDSVLFDKTTLIRISIGGLVALIAGTFSAAYFVNQKFSELSDTRRQVTELREELKNETQLGTMRLSEMSAAVSSLQCREREITAALRGILADIEQMMISIDQDYAQLAEKMRRQLQRDQETVASTNCRSA